MIVGKNKNLTLKSMNKDKKKELSLQRRYIRRYRGNDNPVITLRVIRYILRTPEGFNVVDQAEKIMKRIVKKNL